MRQLAFAARRNVGSLPSESLDKFVLRLLLPWHVHHSGKEIKTLGDLAVVSRETTGKLHPNDDGPGGLLWEQGTVNGVRVVAEPQAFSQRNWSCRVVNGGVIKYRPAGLDWLGFGFWCYTVRIDQPGNKKPQEQLGNVFAVQHGDTCCGEYVNSLPIPPLPDRTENQIGCQVSLLWDPVSELCLMLIIRKGLTSVRDVLETNLLGNEDYWCLLSSNNLDVKQESEVMTVILEYCTQNERTLTFDRDGKNSILRCTRWQFVEPGLVVKALSSCSQPIQAHTRAVIQNCLQAEQVLIARNPRLSAAQDVQRFSWDDYSKAFTSTACRDGVRASCECSKLF